MVRRFQRYERVKVLRKENNTIYDALIISKVRSIRPYYNVLLLGKGEEIFRYGREYTCHEWFMTEYDKADNTILEYKNSLGE